MTRILTGNLAAMLALAASAPVDRTEYEINAPKPTLMPEKWQPFDDAKRYTPPTRKRRDRSRNRMAKASRKRNRR